MPTCTINGKNCEFQKGDSILQVAWENGIEIPHYCYHPGLSVVASCRLCLVEVWAPNPRNEGKLEPIPKLLPACQTPAQDGTEIYSNSPKSIANQRTVMELLLINHPLDCPVCDQAGECHLQDYSFRYGRGESRFEEEKIKQPKKDIGKDILLYSDRCIMCTRCVRFTREISESNELCVNHRGSSEQIDVFPGMPVDNPLSGNIIDVCPVGAMLDKNFLFQQRVWFLTQTPSIDGLTASGDNITIDHNEGRVYRIKPRPNEEVNKWWISDELRWGWDFIHSEDRLHFPLRQQQGTQVETNYDLAYEIIDRGFTNAARAEGGRLALLVSPMLTCEEAHLLAKYIKSYDPQAIMGVGPVPVEGEDQIFAKDKRGEYLLCAEKCPNRRGVERVLRAHADNVLDYETFLATVADKKNSITGVLVTGNYPRSWTSKDLKKALSKKFTVLLDTFPNDISGSVDVVLPVATWAEKSGTFENHQGRLQVFEQAIAPVEFSKSEGQFMEDLINLAQGDTAETPGKPRIFNAARIRSILAEEMGLAEFVSEVHMPDPPAPVESDMELVEL
ncbi:MAG TPA: 2Fe-2S iron-sulfur cluster binding domain-containing protein [Phycisphaeraceae bacterium]|nr:2Fe-2S iron-sulfur cluster binding domain-containing protein [Phycisphaeraceae bacterium]